MAKRTTATRLKQRDIPGHDPCAVGKVTPDQLAELKKPKAPTALTENVREPKGSEYHSPQTKLADPV